MERAPVRVILPGPCRCAGRPHAHDAVELMPDPSVAMGAAVMVAVRNDGNNPPILQARLTDIYLQLGITGWTFQDKDGDQLPVTAENIQACIPWEEGGMEVAERADELYSARCLRPLMNRLSTQSQAGLTAGETSANQPTGSTPPRRSRRSSPRNSGGRR